MTDTENTAPASPAVIESATASTACQTNGSNFSYILTGSVLGVVVVVAAAVLVLLFSLASSGTSAYSFEGQDDGYGYDDGYTDDPGGSDDMDGGGSDSLDGSEGLGGNGSDDYGYEDGDTFGFSYESAWTAGEEDTIILL